MFFVFVQLVCITFLLQKSRSSFHRICPKGNPRKNKTIISERTFIRPLTRDAVLSIFQICWKQKSLDLLKKPGNKNNPRRPLSRTKK